MKGRYVLSDLGIVCALGVGKEETQRRLFAGDASGMKPLGPLSGGDSTVFGFAPLGDDAFAAAPTRIAALVDAAMEQLKDALDGLRRGIPAARREANNEKIAKMHYPCILLFILGL